VATLTCKRSRVCCPRISRRILETSVRLWSPSHTLAISRCDMRAAPGGRKAMKPSNRFLKTYCADCNQFGHERSNLFGGLPKDNSEVLPSSGARRSMQWLLPLVTQADHQPVTVDASFYWELSGCVSIVLGIPIRLQMEVADFRSGLRRRGPTDDVSRIGSVPIESSIPTPIEYG
jgi:hypothetical protein